MNIVQDMPKALEIMHNVGSWMFENGLSTSPRWDPKNMHAEYMLKHTEPTEYYVAMVDNKPVASVILQDNERNLSWEPVDGKDKKQALYVHGLAVHRDFAGQKLSHKLLDFAVEKARELEFDRVRLDTSADNEKLMSLYEDYGFSLRKIESDVDGDGTAYFELLLN